MINNPRKNRTRAMQSGVIRYVDHSLAIAKQINLILKKLDKNQNDLAELLGKKESEISKWLRGTHNFTLKTISKIEDALGESIIICIKDIPPAEYHMLVMSGTNNCIPVKNRIREGEIVSVLEENNFKFLVCSNEKLNATKYFKQEN